LTAEDLVDCIGGIVTYELAATDNPRSPGQLLKHYAPNIPIRLRAVDVAPDEALLAFGSTKFMGIRGGGKASDLPHTQIRNLSETGDLLEAAANLFAMIRQLDNPSNKAIAVMDIPDTGIGIAINDRLSRAAQ
jgi:L-threonylcarbamoyladenylate synthase